MNKSDRILLGAFLILLIGFLINYNGNFITGRFSEDVTGMVALSTITVDLKDVPDLGAQGCGGSGYIHIMCRAKRYCQNLNQGYSTGIQTEFVGNGGVVACFKSNDEGIGLFTSGFGLWGCFTSLSYSGTHDQLMCRAKKYCQAQNYATGFQSEFSGPQGQSGEIYCFKGNDVIQKGPVSDDYLEAQGCEGSGYSHTMCRASRWCRDPVNGEYSTGIQSERIGAPYPPGGEIFCIGTKEISEPSCTDSDVTSEFPDGNNINVGGITTAKVVDPNTGLLWDFTSYDLCISESVIKERYCDGVIPVFEEITCPFGYKCTGEINVDVGFCEEVGLDCGSKTTRDSCVTGNTASVTNCIWHYDANSPNLGHCCGDEEEWNFQLGICETQTKGLCYNFFPGNKVEGEGIKYDEEPEEVCWDVGSMVYGFWTPSREY